MEKHTDILYRLARFLAGVPPEALGAMILVATERPDLLVAIALYVLNAIMGQLITWFGLLPKI